MKRRGLNSGFYFKNIGMNLFQKKTEIESNNSGKIFPLTLIILKVLEKLKDLTIKEIRRLRPSIQNHIKYMITIPAFFDDFQKNIIMKACIKAGLIKEANDISLLFALEPEAALYYSLYNSSNKNLVQKGNFYIICNLGEDTGEIAAHLFGDNKNQMKYIQYVLINLAQMKLKKCSMKR